MSIAITSLVSSQNAEITRLRTERDEAGKALVSLTPDGSEFYLRDGDGYRVDVAACLAYIRTARESQHNLICESVKGRKAAESTRADLVAALKAALPVVLAMPATDPSYREFLRGVRESIQAVLAKAGAE